MYFCYSKLHFIVILIVFAVLTACTTEGYYAPVMTNNNESFEDRQVFLPGNQPSNKSHFITTNAIKKHQSTAYQWPTNSSDSGSRHNFQQPTLWNKKAPPATLSAGLKNTKKSITTKKQPAKLDTVKKKKASQKKTITSINDKKNVTLSFGWPIKGKVLKSFSPSHNKGIDIAGKQQQPVKATEAGTVVYGGQGLIGFGQLLIIKHNAVYLSAYANNSQLLVKEGQYIQKGQIIAEVGKAGIKHSSLHFEIRKNGKPVDPLSLLPRK
jgi:lipoprotein NlpD